MPPDHPWEELCELKSYSPIPVCADEGFVGKENLAVLKQAYDCINIKIMKTGSILKSLQLIRQAHKEELQVLIGCMIEGRYRISYTRAME
jgi:L-alanine-DL-glutamate epimerase-like enolase superfamily enzyme